MKNQFLTAEPKSRNSTLLSPVDPAKILQAIPDVAFVINHEGIIRFISPACLLLFGFRAEEMTGSSVFDFIHPADVDETNKVLSACSAIGNTFGFENRCRKKDGSLAHLIWSARWDENDKLLYIVARDGAEKQEMENRLLKAQQVAKVANYEFDIVTNTYTYVADTIFDLFGIDRKKHPAFTSELFWSRVHPDDMELVKRNVLQPKHLKSAMLEYRIIRPNGEIVYINRIREVIRSASGKPVKNIGMLQDITDRKIGEMALRQSEERFRSLVQNSGDMIAIIDERGNYTFVSDNAHMHLGYTATELTGKNAFDFIHQEDAAAVRNAFQRVKRKRTSTLDPFRFKNPGGDWQWVEVTVTNHLDNAAIRGLVVNSRDVTEKKHKEEENILFNQRLEEQSQMMVEVLEQMRDGFLTVTTEGKIIYWNAAAEQITGLPRETALGKSLWTLYPGIQQTPYFQVYQRLLSSSGPIQEIVFSPFKQRWVELRAYRTGKGISVFFRDMTPEMTAEEELRRLSLIARETTNPVIVQDKNRNVQWVNNAFTELTGYSLQECMGKPISEICDGPDTDASTLRYVDECVAKQKPFRIEALNYKKSGETYWSDISCQPLFDAQGEVIQYFSISTDITERKRLEKQLTSERREQQMKVAAATLKAQERERTVVSQELHDNVNQVLTTVKLYTEMCRDGFGDRKEILEKSISLLQSSINEIRSLSKRLSAPSLGKIKLAESVKELIAAVSNTNQFEVTLNTRDIDSLEVTHDVHLAVYRILQEHLTNILKHADATKVEVTLEMLLGSIHLHVKDNGKGFDMEKKSNGIGITNMSTRAESLHGSFTITSAPGLGCEIRVCIP